MSENTVITSGTSSLSRKTWWTAAVVVLLIGLITAAAWAVIHVVAVAGRPDSFVHTSLPGSVTVGLEAGDRVVAYLEAPAGQPTPRADLLVVGPDGKPVTTQQYPGELTYDVAGDPAGLGHAVLVAEATTAGTYTIGSATPGNPTATTLSVGEDLAHTLLSGILPPALLAGGVLLLAAAMAVAPLTARRQASHVTG